MWTTRSRRRCQSSPLFDALSKQVPKNQVPKNAEKFFAGYP